MSCLGIDSWSGNVEVHMPGITSTSHMPGDAGAALVDDSASHLRKQERFECYASIQSDCIRVRGFYQV